MARLAHLEVTVDKQAAQLITVAQERQGERTDLNSDATSPHDAGKLHHNKDERLRAILRAPEPIRKLYKAGLINQTLATKLGPASDPGHNPATAARVAVAVPAISNTRCSLTRRARLQPHALSLPRSRGSAEP